MKPFLLPLREPMPPFLSIATGFGWRVEVVAELLSEKLAVSIMFGASKIGDPPFVVPCAEAILNCTQAESEMKTDAQSYWEDV